MNVYIRVKFRKKKSHNNKQCIFIIVRILNWHISKTVRPKLTGRRISFYGAQYQVICMIVQSNTLLSLNSTNSFTISRAIVFLVFVHPVPPKIFTKIRLSFLHNTRCAWDECEKISPNKRHRTNAGLMLDMLVNRLRRRAKIKPALDQYVVIYGKELADF